jgi:hypothetical protein
MATEVLYQVFKETTIPTTWVNSSVYFIKAVGATYTECYITTKTGTPTRMINEADVQALISSALSDSNSFNIVANIAARNALLPLPANRQVFVENASDAGGDPTVLSGGAWYLYKKSDNTWIKTGETESMDAVLNWSNIVGKPASTAVSIDNAVAASHAHTNKPQLDKFGENASLQPTYNGKVIVHTWEEEKW